MQHGGIMVLEAGNHLATVGIGSNLGDRKATIHGAVSWFVEEAGDCLKALSSLYETEPFGKKDQPWFLNCVMQVETVRDLDSFFHSLKRVEEIYGRKRQEPWGARTLDLDLLFFDQLVYNDSSLTIPHPGIPYRRFVLEPLCEILPDLVHPGLLQTMSALREKLEDSSRVTLLEKI